MNENHPLVLVRLLNTLLANESTDAISDIFPISTVYIAVHFYTFSVVS